MANIKIIKRKYVDDLIDRVDNYAAFDEYLNDKFIISDSNYIDSPWSLNGLRLRMPDNSQTYEYENAVTLFNGLNKLDRTMASDVRLWTYLTNIHFWNYMKERRGIKEYFEKVEREGSDPQIINNKKRDYIFEHYLIKTTSIQNFCRCEISGLWWGAFLTYDKERGAKKEFELTNEYFSMLDYTRHLTGGQIGRCKNIVHGVLEFVITNPKLFSKYKAEKVRWIMRYINRMGGIKPLSALSKTNVINKLNQNSEQIDKIAS
jgi:hypothetical protein